MSWKIRIGVTIAFTSIAILRQIGPAGASMRADLVGRTLSCAGGSHIRFSANGTSATISGPGGTKRAAVRWHDNNVELWLPGKAVPLGVDKDGNIYAFQEAACE
jgi:hypothetical protein